jgi:hypothetical protein
MQGTVFVALLFLSFCSGKHFHAFQKLIHKGIVVTVDYIGYDVPEEDFTINVGEEILMINLFEMDVDIKWMPSIFEPLTLSHNHSALFLFEFAGDFEYQVTRSDFNGGGDLPAGNVIFSSVITVEDSESGSEEDLEGESSEDSSSEPSEYSEWGRYNS